MYSEDEILSSIKDTKTCLKPSLIEGAGIGVFALRDIRKDESLYHRKYYEKYLDIENIPHFAVVRNPIDKCVSITMKSRFMFLMFRFLCYILSIM